MRNLHQIPPLLFFWGCMHHHWLQAFSFNTQQGSGHVVSAIAAHYATIHQYRVHIIYKLGQELYITDWLSRNNHTEGRDQDTTGVHISVNAISTAVNMLVCISIGDIQVATCQDAHLQKLRWYIIQGWPHRKHKLEGRMKNYWPKGVNWQCFMALPWGARNNASFSIAETNHTAVAHQPLGYREDETHSMWVGILDKYTYRKEKQCKTGCHMHGIPTNRDMRR